MQAFLLSNGVAIPAPGFGIWQSPNGCTTVSAVQLALSSGYRHIDCISCRENESEVGKGIAKSGVSRNELFITGRLRSFARGYESVRQDLEKTLFNLRLDYLDLYLIHQPAAGKQFENWEEIIMEAWHAMTALYREGKLRAIGTSCFQPCQLEALLAAQVPPMVNQIEYHPGCKQTETVNFCQAHGILLEARSPLGHGGKVLSDPRLAAIGRKYKKSPAQICIRWELQNNVLPLPASQLPSHIQQNLEVFDFELSRKDMRALDQFELFNFN